MSSESKTVQPAVLITIIGETVLQDRILQMLTSLGATGYTLTPARGVGSHGRQMGDIAGYNTNIEVKTIVSQSVSDDIFSSIADYKTHHALIAFRQNVEALMD
ncbi:P-II family nitrogen regulator [Iningainema tapete]|uniref:Uncharacterized protein n=1 Tax=Iningainema tapete BLCC-T55 TaxID=2748662 RepID=A0A8J6XR16_9CYAN|nr:hypothetical protein [Iningainema tapete]MBD2771988.1 hypothetical protein [Iningainema tapete BLCC-T55]